MTAASPPAPLAVSTDDAAELIGLGLTYTKELIRKGEIPSFLCGRRRLVAMSDLQAFIEARRRGDGALGQHA